MQIRKAETNDVQRLADLFIGHITAHREYISHGEIQMGVGKCRLQDGHLTTEPAEEAREKWVRYICGNINGGDEACVWVAEEDEKIIGFCAAEIQEDGDKPFGVLCDLFVSQESRGSGTGDRLMKTAISWIREKGVSDIYLESGKDNHPAHEFFKRRGFHLVSEIYKLG